MTSINSIPKKKGKEREVTVELKPNIMSKGSQVKNGGLGAERTRHRVVGRIRAKALGSKKESVSLGNWKAGVLAYTEASRKYCRREERGSGWE